MTTHTRADALEMADELVKAFEDNGYNPSNYSWGKLARAVVNTAAMLRDLAPPEQKPVDGLLPCPFCGSGETEIRETRLPPTMKGPGAIVSVRLQHWCDRPDGVVATGISFTGRERSNAIEQWNRRALAPPEQPDAVHAAERYEDASVDATLARGTNFVERNLLSRIERLTQALAAARGAGGGDGE